MHHRNSYCTHIVIGVVVANKNQYGGQLALPNCVASVEAVECKIDEIAKFRNRWKNSDAIQMNKSEM